MYPIRKGDPVPGRWPVLSILENIPWHSWQITDSIIIPARDLDGRRLKNFRADIYDFAVQHDQKVTTKVLTNDTGIQVWRRA